MNLTFLDIFDSNFDLDLQDCSYHEKSANSALYLKESRALYISHKYLLFPSCITDSFIFEYVTRIILSPSNNTHSGNEHIVKQTFLFVYFDC